MVYRAVIKSSHGPSVFRASVSGNHVSENCVWDPKGQFAKQELLLAENNNHPVLIFYL